MCGIVRGTSVEHGHGFEEEKPYFSFNYIFSSFHRYYQTFSQVHFFYNTRFEILPSEDTYNPAIKY